MKTVNEDGTFYDEDGRLFDTEGNRIFEDYEPNTADAPNPKSPPDQKSIGGETQWPEPSPIEPKLPPVKKLDAELIPEPYRDWLVDSSHRMQTPVDFAAIGLIVVTSSVIGAGCCIYPKRRDYGFAVIPNLWGGAIARPSVVLKSPTLKEATSPLDKLQADYGAILKQRWLRPTLAICLARLLWTI